jgi:hypothetical protein
MVFAGIGLGLAVTACGGGGSSSTSSPPASPAPASASAQPTVAASAAMTTPAATTSAAAVSFSPVGIWYVAYTATTDDILGQYDITPETGGTTSYYLTTATTLEVPGGNCSLGSGIEVGTFTESGTTAGSYVGAEMTYQAPPGGGTCVVTGTNATFDVTASGDNTLTLLAPGQQSVTLTKAGNAPAAAAPAASPTSCIVPNYIGAGGSNSSMGAATAASDMHNVTYVNSEGDATECAWSVKIVDNVDGGDLSKEVPAPGTVVPPGGTVTLYF